MCVKYAVLSLSKHFNDVEWSSSAEQNSIFLPDLWFELFPLYVNRMTPGSLTHRNGLRNAGLKMKER